MPYEAKAAKTYSHPTDKTIQTVTGVIQTLGGKPSKKNDPALGRLEANFNKKIKGEYINNRLQLEVSVTAQSPEQALVSAEAYPVDPIGRKLMFGVLGKPAEQLIRTFFAELDTQINR